MISATISLCLLVSGALGDVTTDNPIGTNCTSSYECGIGICCRDAFGQMVDGSHDFQRPLGHLANGGHILRSGICSSRLGQAGEVCGFNCGCDQGLECYRPVTGECCPPMRCYDAAYVQKQREYWSHCLSNPLCAVPP